MHPGDRTLLADVGGVADHTRRQPDRSRTGQDKSSLPLPSRLGTLRDFAAIVPISALRDDGVDVVLDEAAKLLPERAGASTRTS